MLILSFLTLLPLPLLQTKKLFPSGFYAAIRYYKVNLTMMFSSRSFNRYTSFFFLSVTSFGLTAVLQCCASIHMCCSLEETRHQRSWRHLQVLHRDSKSIIRFDSTSYKKFCIVLSLTYAKFIDGWGRWKMILLMRNLS